jgi:hypothetical protein
MLPPRGATDFTVSCNPEFRVLAPVSVLTMRDPSIPVLVRCTGYLHVPGVPDHPSWPVDWTLEDKLRHLNGVLAKKWEDDVFDAKPGTIEKRKWSGNANALNTPSRNTLLQQRQLTITWTQCKNIFRDNKRNTGLTEADFEFVPPA